MPALDRSAAAAVGQAWRRFALIDLQQSSRRSGNRWLAASGAVSLAATNGARGVLGSGRNEAALTHATVTPRHFCTKLTRRCSHPGATLEFDLTERVEVVVAIANGAETKLVGERTLKVHAGHNSIPIMRLQPGRYRMSLTEIRHDRASKPVEIPFSIEKAERRAGYGAPWIGSGEGGIRTRDGV